MTEIEKWNSHKSAALYGLDSWGQPYFSPNDNGTITVTPNGSEGPKLDLYDLVNQVKARGIGLPILFRFNGILRNQVDIIHRAFHTAIKEQNYTGRYTLCFPIKVNQQRHVVDILRAAGEQYQMGLEVGSKPELIAVLGLQNAESGPLLCNGYKDAEYIELALMSKKVGRRPIITIEKLSELQTVLDVSEKLNVTPEIGFRIRLSGKGSGRWEKSGGERAKFGLTIGEIVEAFETLKKKNMLSIISLLHFHVGSQITAIDALKVALREAVQVYIQLRRDCPNLTMLDVGGGLGVDYDGSKTTFASSMNYTVDEYARDIVWILGEACEQAGVPAPDIISESGRALAAHHAVLVFNALGIANSFSYTCNINEILSKTKHKTVTTLCSLYQELTPKNCQETLNDALQLRQDVLDQFNLGIVSITDRALVDEVFWGLLYQIKQKTAEMFYVPEDLERLAWLLTDTYFCNFSVFQSMPDSWAIQQIFPVMPIHRLNEQPTRSVVLADISCDSDGKIDRFADLKDVKRYLPVHAINETQPYYFATFFVGAYQEILGDLHNLFGDTNAVHVEVNNDGRIQFSDVVLGDSIREVLQYVQYDKNDLIERWRNSVEDAVDKGLVSAEESASIYRKYVGAFDAYTYLGSGPEV
ncbi:biosynthetic arginine decarboxylase [bacterium]|nr:biosynthetic arginine decarboxylase [bacterium]